MSARPRCLVVDDDDAMLLLATIRLEDAGAEVMTSTVGATALEMVAASEPFSLVLADLNLQDDVSGLEVLGAAAERNPNTILVVMTAHLDDHVRSTISAASPGLDVTVVSKLDLGRVTALLASSAAADQ